jgi:hypothetical protein
LSSAGSSLALLLGILLGSSRPCAAAPAPSCDQQVKDLGVWLRALVRSSHDAAPGLRHLALPAGAILSGRRCLSLSIASGARGDRYWHDAGEGPIARVSKDESLQVKLHNLRLTTVDKPLCFQLSVDRAARWSSVVALVSYLSAKPIEVAFVFDHADPAARPGPSALQRELDALGLRVEKGGLTGPQHEILGNHTHRLHRHSVFGSCSLVKGYRAADFMAAAQDATLLADLTAKHYGARLKECGCKTDVASLRSLLYVMSYHPAYAAVWLKLGAGGTALALPAAAAWQTAHVPVVEASRQRKLYRLELKR